MLAQGLHVTFPHKMQMENKANLHPLHQGLGVMPEIDPRQTLTPGSLTTMLLCRTKNIVQAAVQKRNSEALSAMTFAATLGDVDSMEHLLQRGLLINTADYDGRTTLHLAALEGNVKVLELLLHEGADPNVRDRYVLPTPLYVSSCLTTSLVCHASSPLPPLPPAPSCMPTSVACQLLVPMQVGTHASSACSQPAPWPCHRGAAGVPSKTRVSTTPLDGCHVWCVDTAC